MFVSFPDADWRDDVGPIDGITPVVWHPRDPGPDAPVDAVVAPYVGAARSIAAELASISAGASVQSRAQRTARPGKALASKAL